MERKEIVNKVIAKLAKKIKDDSNTFINKIKTDNGFLWEVGLNTEQVHQIKDEKEAVETLNELKNKEKKLEASSGILKKVKDLKNKLIHKKYKTLNEENALSLTKDLSKKHYWNFDVPKNPKIEKRKFKDVPIIDIAVDNSEVGNTISVWYDPILGELFGDYKEHIKSKINHNPEFHFKPLTLENAVEYAKTVDSIKVDTNKKPKKIKQDGQDMIDVPIISGDEEYSLLVWYDPSYMGLYGEW